MKSLRIFFGFCCLIFLLFTYWQFNDPDAWFWVGIYGFAAVMAGMAAFRKYAIPLLLVAAFLSFAGFIYKYPSSVSGWIQQEWMQKDLAMKTNSMELARESFGLLMVCLVMLAAAATAYLTKRKNAARSNRHNTKQQQQLGIAAVVALYYACCSWAFG